MRINFRAMVVKQDDQEVVVALHPSNFPKMITDMAKLLYEVGDWKVVQLSKKQFVDVTLYGITKFEKGEFFNETK